MSPICSMNARCNGCERSILGCVPDRKCGDRADCALLEWQRRIKPSPKTVTPEAEQDDLIDMLDAMANSIASYLEDTGRPAQRDDHSTFFNDGSALLQRYEKARRAKE